MRVDVAEIRRTAFAVAYRMLGSIHDAEDVVQETLLRIHEADGRGIVIDSPQAYTATVATRLAIDQLRSARVRREVYVGDWLPEPLLDNDADDPAARAELADSLSMAFLTLLETLSPEQRASLLLHDVFCYGYDEVARILRTSEANARQLAARARQRAAAGRPRFRTSRAHQDELADRFFAAAGAGDLTGLEALLTGDAALRGDGGGKAPALARPVHGRARVARTLAAWFHAALRHGALVQRVRVNGAPGVLLQDGAGRTVSVVVLDIDGDQVRSVSSVINPDKLGHLGEVADIPAALKRGRIEVGDAP